MNLTVFDWLIIGGFLLLTFVVGISTTKSAGKSKEDFFLGGRSMPWWLLGFSMVATTFSSDTPTLVASMVRQLGISGNWNWWALLPGGMLTVFLYAKLWRRSECVTDIEFYELRYSGKIATFLRQFRSIFFGLIVNMFSIAVVTLAFIKICGSMLHLAPWQTLVISMGMTAIFSSAGGLRGVLLTDMLLFIIAMFGSVAAAVILVRQPEIGGLAELVRKLESNPATASKIGVMTFGSAKDFIATFIIPISLAWWSVWYPGSEPGGGSFIVQRMLAAKDESHAMRATLFFNLVHYSIRPWPWLIVALASLVIFPDHAALVRELGGILPEHQITDDVSYSLMLARLPHGWLGLMLTTMAAAYISTLSTWLNLTSSYMVNDLYLRFLKPTATPKEQVWVGRILTVVVCVISGVLALALSDAKDAFQFVFSFGAGSGLVYMLRWFWWRINALSELIAVVSSFIFALYFTFIHPNLFPNLPIDWSTSLVLQTILVTGCWMLAAIFGPETGKQQLYEFCRKINPVGPGWSRVRAMADLEGVDLQYDNSKKESITASIAAAVMASLMVYGILFASGAIIFRHWGLTAIYTAVTIVSAAVLWKLWKRCAIWRKPVLK